LVDKAFKQNLEATLEEGYVARSGGIKPLFGMVIIASKITDAFLYVTLIGNRPAISPPAHIDNVDSFKRLLHFPVSIFFNIHQVNILTLDPREANTQCRRSQ